MGRYRSTTGLREIIEERKLLSTTAAVLMLVAAGIYFYYIKRPQTRPAGGRAYYTIDDGRTWFIDSIYKTPPFTHGGKVAVRAMVYSYDNGKHEFCPFVERYTSEKKESLDEAISQALRENKPVASIALFNSPETLEATEVKTAGSGHDWVSRSDKVEASKILDSVQSPDGSAMDFVIP